MSTIDCESFRVSGQKNLRKTEILSSGGTVTQVHKMMKNEDFGLFRALDAFFRPPPGYQLILKNDRSRSSDGVGGTSAA